MPSYFITPPQVANRNDFTGALGSGFIPNFNITINRLGRYFGSSTHDHVVKIWQNGNSVTPVLTATISAASASDANGYKFASVAPVNLTAGTRYYILVDETASGDSWDDQHSNAGNITLDVTYWGYAYSNSNGGYPDATSAGNQGFDTGTFDYTLNLFTWYVSSSNGSDGNGGTIASAPFKTIAQARSVASAGDTILLNRGDSWTETNSFTSGVIIDAYGSGAAPRVTATSSTANAITFTNCAGKVRNVRLVGTNTGTPNGGSVTFGASRPCGVEFLNTQTGQNQITGAEVSGCEISGFQNAVGAFATDTTFAADSIATSSGFTGLRVTGNVLHDCYDCGVKTGNNTTARTSNFIDPYVGNNSIYNITGNSSFNSGFGVFLMQATGSNQGESNATGVIDKNLIWTIGYGAQHNDAGGPACALTCFCQKITFQWNEVWDCSKNKLGDDGLGIDLDIDSQNCVVQYNFPHDCDSSGIYGYLPDVGNVFRFNWSVGNCRSGTGSTFEIDIYSAADPQVHNNTASGPRNGLRIRGTRTVGTLRVVNNAINVPAGNTVLEVDDDGTHLVIKGNAYWDTTANPTFKYLGATQSGLAAFRTASSQETASGTVADPKFFRGVTSGYTIGATSLLPIDINFQPASGSSLIGAGQNIQTLYGYSPGSQDVSGAALSVPYNIGAFNLTYSALPARIPRGIDAVQNQLSLGI